MRAIAVFIFFCALCNFSSGNLCSKSDQRWRKHGSKQFIKEWLKSANASTEDSSPRISLHKFIGVSLIDLATEIDAKTGQSKNKGWKTAAHYMYEVAFQTGYLYGTLDSNGTMTGQDVVYIYPDFETVLVGTFERDVMIGAKEAKIIGHKCRRGILDVRISRPKLNSPTFKFDPPASFFRISQNSTIRDPMEVKNVYIVSGEYGDSLWAKKDFEPHEIVAYYNGLWYEKEYINWSNMTEDETWDFHKNLIGVDDKIDLNIPKEYWSLEKYRATLGHKVNHSFTKANTWFGSAYHPRFGHVRTINAETDIKKGEECLIDYKYSIYANVPEWYKQAYVLEVGPLPSVV